MEETEICEVCNKADHTLLCDYEVGTGVVTSLDWQEVTKSCDKKMCRNCTTRLWRNCDVCPEHAELVTKTLAREAAEK